MDNIFRGHALFEIPYQFAVTPDERHGDKRALPRRLFHNALHVPRAQSHRLFHRKGNAAFQQGVGKRGHFVMRRKGEYKVRLFLVQQFKAVRISATAQRGGYAFRQRSVRVADGGDVERIALHGPQIQGYVPVADADESNFQILNRLTHDILLLRGGNDSIAPSAFR